MNEDALAELFGIAIVAEFVGGPRDGETQQLPRLEHRWLVPIARQLTLDEMRTFGTYPNPDNPHERTEVAMYDVALDSEMKRPSLNDAGHYRYEFKGYR